MEPICRPKAGTEALGFGQKFVAARSFMDQPFREHSLEGSWVGLSGVTSYKYGL